jgi:hypothetical protein
MTDRPKVDSEKDLHSTMYAKELLGGTARGGAAGAALGALLKHTGHGVGPGTLGTAGAILGGIHGGLKGRERSMRDVVTQQRMHQRAEARKKPREEKKEAMTPYESIKWAAFSDEITKEAFLGALGQTIVGGLNQGARAAGVSGGFGRALSTGRKFFGGGAGGVERLNQVVGGGALAAGGLGLMAAGRATAPGPRY